MTMRIFAGLAVFLFLASGASAQSNEIGLTLGGFATVDRSTESGADFSLGSGTAFQADYKRRLVDLGVASVSIGAHFLASPLRDVSSSLSTLTRDVATIYATPDIMVKIFPHAGIQPWATIGGGFAVYEHSTALLDGSPNPVSRTSTHGVLEYGAGVDVPVLRWVALRAEIRDFYSGSPSYNAAVSGGQHNVVAGGGFVLRFGR